MKRSIPLVVYVVVQFVAFLLVLAGTSADMFRIPRGSLPTLCITLWGLRLTCNSSGYAAYIDATFRPCPHRIARFRLAQAFALISILVYGAAFVLGLVLLFYCSLLRLVCLVLNIVGAVTLCVVWAAMAVTYNKDEHAFCRALKLTGLYAAGFALFLVAWILDILNIIFLLLPCTVPATKANEKPESPTAQE
ncbi:amastin-like surface protein-like protein [Leishmania major strain Friedlin]|uniref:Amastin-like surface protein-like protein n=1 Tax=Leishmania major TaxID=5664 RepID=Q4Q1U9_LEIMA|nr:amastin-like surface protein-like protein [Leishmania major strain Friedlin]CAG9583646.1 amastin-like_surface_protein-like_protein [Leishmania major strain Friedlin]CAJ09080.1 amastin-like surface protein-like protein [Leishmania major strain Friedlin]|eukprot:XP_001686699.1 amastin-like surface protein-like protein [Leishmania major strain Friedlin]